MINLLQTIGEYTLTNENKTTLQDIADKAHVSKALVSRVLNNRPVRVSDKKREQILKIANEMDYIPTGKILSLDPSAPKLNKTIALLVPHLNNKFMSDLSETITEEAYENGYSVMIFDTQEDSALEMRYLELCHYLKVSGIILDSFSSANNKKYIEKLTEWNIPFLFLDCYPNTPGCPVVSSTNQKSMFQLTESLIQKGHRDILCIIQDKSTLTNVSLERLNGYYSAMDKYGLSGHNEIIYPNRDYKEQPVYSLLNSSKKFTAFIILTGFDIEHFCNLIISTEYYNRSDFEIGVFDDFNVSFLDHCAGIHRKTYQRITDIVRQRPKEMAKLAIDSLIEHIRKGEQYTPIRAFIECDLVTLDSGRKGRKE